MTEEQAPSADATGALPEVRISLADLLDGEPPLPHAYLLVLTGSARGTTLVVDTLPVVIGRGEDADLVLADETVSRTHARIAGDRDAIGLEDLGSSNGTMLNGNPIAGAITILDGDLLALGSAMVLVKRVA